MYSQIYVRNMNNADVYDRCNKATDPCRRRVRRQTDIYGTNFAIDFSGRYGVQLPYIAQLCLY
jgi:hypothetical protein